MPPVTPWDEQPGGPPSVATPDRRTVLRLMAASFALGGLAGCDPADPEAHYIPAVVAPPGIVPGVPNFYATASTAGGTALGLVIEHKMGRPIKVEGNPAHPSSLGATDAVAQAMILDFYDPVRAIGIQNNGRPSERQSMTTAVAIQRAFIAASRGRGFRILTGPVCSPTLAAAIKALQTQYPEARWHVWEPSAPTAARHGTTLAYGAPVEVVPRLGAADVVVALDSDLLESVPGHLRYAREFASRRNPVRAAMSRVYAVEPSPTLIGAAADHRVAAGPQALQATVAGLAATLLGGSAPADAPAWVAPIAADLKAAHGRAFLHAGPSLPPEAHALVHAINEALGGRGHTYDLLAPPLVAGESLETLLADMAAGQVAQLLVLDSNPAFTAPAFNQAQRRVPFVLSAAPALDETGQAATWFVPLAHPFETWGDARGHDGTATIQQPQTLPLHRGASPLEILAWFAGPAPADPLAQVRATWRNQLPTEEAWRDALALGIVNGTANPPLPTKLRPEASSLRPPPPAPHPVTVLFRPDPYLLDGRLANNAWLQELPRPHTKLVWDNPILLAPALAARLGVDNGDRVSLQAGPERAELPIWIVPGQADDVAIAVLGNGRRIVGAVGEGAGFDLYPLRTAAAEHPPALQKAAGHIPLATTDRHYRLEADTKDILRHRTLAQFDAGDHAQEPGNPNPETLLYRRHPEAEVQWGMSIDLNACIGCNACVVACQSENNVPVVGKEQVLKHREMHWLRIDRYDIGDAPEIAPAFQPMLCMHCEQAPCEVVCPVEATQHDSEGLNLMVYNRCIGTRFCSNNCPYKVRRFNYANWVAEEMRPPIARNPDVTARTRGVMEKCTFCVQRIVDARIAHDRDGVPERATTACQAACPTQAIVFGDIRDADAAVTARKQSPIDYPLLPEVSTFPRVTYEARIRNRNTVAAA
ncbi:MAG: 4Fe-4S dicluster domain-containing protein [Acetobacteraceae bacterium]|nr:4Fe-4S dicluster domain-containing protein [Acetobacteraceae bacterium]